MSEPMARDRRVSPIRDGVLRLADSRRLAWAEWGRSEGPAAMLLHTSPGSRLLDPDPDATEAAGVRLITVDRPGFGGSDAVPDPTMAGFGGDLAALAAALELRRVALVGWSGGGLYAVAAAARALADRVASLSLLVSPAPDDEVPWVMDAFRVWQPGVREDPAAALPAIAKGLKSLGGQSDALLQSWTGPAEAPVVERTDVAAALAAWIREAVRQDGMGMACDVVAGWRGEPLLVEEVQVPAHLWYGEADAIGTEHGEWYAARLRRATLTVLPDAGHLLPIANWRRILEAAMG